MKNLLNSSLVRRFSYFACLGLIILCLKATAWTQETIPTAVAYGTGGLYVAEANGGLIGGSTTVQDAMSTIFMDWATGIAVDSGGDVVAVDGEGGPIYEITSDGSINLLNGCNYANNCNQVYWVPSDGPYLAQSSQATSDGTNFYVCDGSYTYEWSGYWSYSSGGCTALAYYDGNVYTSYDDGLAYDSSGDVFVSDGSYVYENSTTIYSGDLPFGLATNSGTLYIADEDVNSVVEVSY